MEERDREEDDREESDAGKRLKPAHRAPGEGVDRGIGTLGPEDQAPVK
jgi:hypothetical protein